MDRFGMTMGIRTTIFFITIVTALSYGCKSSSDAPEEQRRSPEELVKSCHLVSGAGAAANGGQGGTIYYITSLSDEKDETGVFPAGTLRYAVSQSDARLIVFNVSGVIHLKSTLKISKGNVTILGQSAPGYGICIADYPTIVEASNVIIRFVHFRMGDVNKVEGDALSCISQKNVVLDHCSFSWSTDECCSCYGNEDFTMQWCMITESLRNSVHGKGRHGYGGIWGGKKATFHHNLLAHHDSRNPRFDHDYVESTNVTPVDFVNNVVYNWGGNSAYGGESLSKTGNQRQYNFINNYYKPGPATKSGVTTRLLNPTTSCSDCTKNGGSTVPGKFYLIGNYMNGSSTVTSDNWTGVFPDESSKKSQCKSTSRFTFENAYVDEQSAEMAYKSVLAKAGCSLRRDIIDQRIVSEVEGKALHGGYTYSGSNGSNYGLIDTQSDVGGWPDYTQGEVLKDSDNDGMPDYWEIRYGLNPNLFADARRQTIAAGYTNLELCLADLVKDLY